MNGQYVLEDNVTVALRCYDCKCSLSQSKGGVFGTLLLIIFGFGIVLFVADVIFVRIYNNHVKAHHAFVVCCQSRRHLYFIVAMILFFAVLFVFALRQAVYYTLSNHELDLEQMEYRFDIKPRSTLRSSQHNPKNALSACLLSWDIDLCFTLTTTCHCCKNS